MHSSSYWTGTGRPGPHRKPAQERGTGRTTAGVLSMLALDERPHQEFPDVSAGLAATLALVQALGDVGAEFPMWLATTGAVSADAAAAIWNRQARPRCGAWGG